MQIINERKLLAGGYPMLRKIMMVVLVVSASIFAASTVFDSVKVPVKVIDGSGLAWTGKVTYWLVIGDNDSLNISLKIDPVNTASPACVINKVSGDVGMYPMVNGMNGKREIFFECSFATAPTATDMYTATVGISADMSTIEKTARLMLAAIPSTTEKIKMITGDGYFNTRDADGGTYGVIKGFKMIDGPHGVNIWRQGSTTAFPSECATACTFDTALAYKIGKAIGNEARPTADGRNVNLGPMLNMVRDPRGGRDFETYGEDPYVMAKMSIAHIQGIQSEKVIATPKHFVCNDQERDRVYATANVGDTTLRQSYAYPFEMAVRKASPWAIMGAYNKLNNVYCTENKPLLIDMLKNEWGFRGVVMTDWFTLMTIAGAANGTDIEMDQSKIFGNIAVGSDGVTQAILDDKILRVLRTKLWTGCATTFGTLPLTLCAADHIAVAYEAAKKSIVLVKNDPVVENNNKPLLPLDKNTITTVAVVGPYAGQVLTGPFGPVTSSTVTPCVNDKYSPVVGITNKVGAPKIVADWTTADVVIVVVSTPISGDLASNEGQDKPDATLPVSEALKDPITNADIPSTNQNALISQILAAKKKVIVVLEGGSAVIKSSWYDAPAVVVAFFAGQRMGMALADILFGDVNPSGKLSVSFPVKEADLPEFTNDKQYIAYEKPNEGRGYPNYIARNVKPLLPFGFGLSYTTFTYSSLVVPSNAAIGAKVKVSVNVTNSGAVAGDEIVQLYLTQNTPVAPRPVKQLRGFARVTLAPSETKKVEFELTEMDFAHWSKPAGWIVDPSSTYTISVAKNSMDATALTGTITLE
jgi:beta-glucosidase